MLDAIEDLAGLVFVCKVETDKCKVSTPEADGGELAGHRGSRSQGAKRDDRIGDPKLFRSNCYTFGLVLARNRGEMREDEMVRGEVEGAVDLLTTASQGHIVNLEKKRQLALLRAVDLAMPTLATRVFSMP